MIVTKQSVQYIVWRDLETREAVLLDGIRNTKLSKSAYRSSTLATSSATSARRFSS